MADKVKPKIVRDQDGNYAVQEQQSDGSWKTRGDKGMLAPIHNMDEREAVFMFLELADKASSKRAAAVSLLARILSEQLERVAPWQGKGDAQKGIDVELKGAFQKCEDRYFEKFMDPKHADHALFIGRLPKLDSKGSSLEIDGKLEPRKQFEAFLTNTRREPSYANNKNTVLGYFNLCGKLPYDDKGDIVPPEIMAQEVSNARIVVARDNSLKARLWELRNELVDEKKAPPGDDLPAILRTLAEMTDITRQMENVVAARLTAAGGRVGSTQAQSDEAIRKAQESTSLGKQAVKQPETPLLEAPAS